MEEKPKSVEQALRSRRMIWIVVAVLVVAMVAVSGVAAFSLFQQPDIEVIKVNFGTTSESPRSSTPVDLGRVSGWASFSLVANVTGTYDMTFDDTFDECNDKSIGLSYSINGQSTSQTFDVSGFLPSVVGVSLNKSDTLSGQFTIVGGSYNDVDFWITGSTYSATMPVTFVLVNRGLTGGYATVGIQSNGQVLWSKSYYVSAGQQSPESTSMVFPTCSSPQLTVAVLSQQKG
jgi:hypothetical protein